MRYPAVESPLLTLRSIPNIVVAPLFDQIVGQPFGDVHNIRQADQKLYIIADHSS